MMTHLVSVAVSSIECLFFFGHTDCIPVRPQHSTIPLLEVGRRLTQLAALTHA